MASPWKNSCWAWFMLFNRKRILSGRKRVKYGVADGWKMTMKFSFISQLSRYHTFEREWFILYTAGKDSQEVCKWHFYSILTLPVSRGTKGSHTWRRWGAICCGDSFGMEFCQLLITRPWFTKCRLPVTLRMVATTAKECPEIHHILQ